MLFSTEGHTFPIIKEFRRNLNNDYNIFEQDSFPLKDDFETIVKNVKFLNESCETWPPLLYKKNTKVLENFDSNSEDFPSWTSPLSESRLKQYYTFVGFCEDCQQN